MTEERADSHASADDKSGVRGTLDLRSVQWQRPLPADVDPDDVVDPVEIAFVPHTDGRTYVAMRQASAPDGATLVFTPSEWDAFVAGAADGEFDEPW